MTKEHSSKTNGYRTELDVSSVQNKRMNLSWEGLGVLFMLSYSIVNISDQKANCFAFHWGSSDILEGKSTMRLGKIVGMLLQLSKGGKKFEIGWDVFGNSLKLKIYDG